jgi:hypothetical protein
MADEPRPPPGRCVAPELSAYVDGKKATTKNTKSHEKYEHNLRIRQTGRRIAGIQ